jgi:hypothetical protein
VTLATTTTVTGINWSGLYSASFGGGSPGSLLQTFAVGNAVNRTLGINRAFSGTTIQSFDYSAEINFVFNGGVTHWLSILNNTAGDGDDFYQSVVSPSPAPLEFWRWD